MHVLSAALSLLLTTAVSVSTGQSPQPPCSKVEECVQIVHEAIAQSDYERAHDVAWRAVQVGPRNDPTLMLLLARTQSLVGRPQDAIVMLRRIVGLGFRPGEALTESDFERVRSLPGWTEFEGELQNAASLEPVPHAVGGTPVRAEAAASPRRGARTGSSPKPEPARRASSEFAPEKSTPAANPSTAPAAVARPEEARPNPAAAAAPAIPPAKAEITLPGLPVPTAPYTLAYDSVSARFVVADETSDTLKVVDERTGNVIDLVSPGWAGAHRPTALAIDARRGELWAAAVARTGDSPASSIYKLQLVSGRLLQTIKLPEDAGDAELTDISVGRNAVYLLDRDRRRVFSVSEGAREARVAADLQTLDAPVSIAVVNDSVMYVAHKGGLARVDLNGRRRLPVPVPAAADLAALQSITWHDGALFAIGGEGSGQSAMRIRLDPRGTTAIAVDPLGPALSPASGVYNGVFYYVTRDADGTMVLRGARVK